MFFLQASLIRFCHLLWQTWPWVALRGPPFGRRGRDVVLFGATILFVVSRFCKKKLDR